MTPTKYPGIDWEKTENHAKKFGCKLTYFDLTGNSEKVSRKFCLDLSGREAKMRKKVFYIVLWRFVRRQFKTDE